MGFIQISIDKHIEKHHKINPSEDPNEIRKMLPSQIKNNTPIIYTNHI